MKNRTLFKCLHCGWEWLSFDNPPVRCARCKTPYWNRQPIRNINNNLEDSGVCDNGTVE
jgi:predicted Zn-ribbon and HTH transcriptional regulator